MSYFRQFKKFDPKTGYVRGYPFKQLPEIAERARAILWNRTAEQIEAAAYGIDWAIDEYFNGLLNQESERLRREASALELCGVIPGWPPSEEELEEIPTKENTSELAALKECVVWWDDLGGEEFPDGKQHEFFAVLSLWLVADALSWLESTKELEERNILAVVEAAGLFKRTNLSELCDDDIQELTTSYSLAGDSALKAMDAVCHAEHLREVHSLADRLKASHHEQERKRRSMLAEKLNIARHQKTKEAKALTIDEWQKNPSAFPSAEKAGYQLSDWLATQGYQYEPRTITNWIRGYAKERGIRLR